MKKQKASGRLAVLEIILSVVIIAGAALLVVSREQYEWGFAVVFGCSAVLLFVRGIDIFLEDRPKAMLGFVTDIIGSAVMSALTTAVILTLLD